MSKPKHESVAVPVSREERIKHIVFAIACCALGLFLIAEDFVSNADDHTLTGYGALVLAVSIFFLVRSIRTTTELKLTAYGRAAKERDISKRDAAFISIALFIAAIIGIIYAIEPISELLESKSRVYFIHCAKRLPADSNVCAVWEPSLVATYSVHADQQFVILSTSERGLPPNRLHNCAVVDRINWACTEENGTGQISMSDSEFSSTTAPSTLDSRVVTRLKWWTTWLDAATK
ncbi:MAG: hypothetical protein ACYDBZ_00465 [Steroidobacteraceae bacterium]